MKTIAVIDDDIHINDMLNELLTQEGYRVMRAWSGTEALLLFQAETPDLVLLDLMLPGLDGGEVLKSLGGLPVIVLSARAAVQDKVKLLMDGAADYITKPFDARELLARICVQLRMAESQRDESKNGRGRTVTEKEYLFAEGGSQKDFGAAAISESGDQVLSYEAITLTPALHAAAVSGCPLHLTPTEFAILKLLMENPSQILTKSLLLERLGEETPDCVESSLKVHISNLRRKLRSAGAGDCIESVWGIGFKLRPGGAKS